jgi:hypothetical protein
MPPMKKELKFLPEHPSLWVPNSAIKECENYTDLSGKEFVHPSKSGTSRPTLTKEQQEYTTRS